MLESLVCAVKGHKPIPYFRTKATGAFTISLCARCHKWGLFYNFDTTHGDKGQWSKDLDTFTRGRSYVDWDCLISDN